MARRPKRELASHQPFAISADSARHAKASGAVSAVPCGKRCDQTRQRRRFKMHARRLAIVLGVATIASAEAAGQSTPTDTIRARATAYVVTFVQRFSTVVAEEHYVQESAALPRTPGSGSGRIFDQPTPIRRVLGSDFLLLRREAGAEWNTFRDVFEVDGRPVRDRSERLTRLLASPTAESNEEARRIAFEACALQPRWRRPHHQQPAHRAGAAPAAHSNPVPVHRR